MTRPFDPTISLQLDKAIVALETARERKDVRREEHAASWKRRLENYIFEDGNHEQTDTPR